MAAFPAVPRVITVEIFVNGAWTDITNNVYVRAGVTISRGRKDEQSHAAPSTCQLMIDNRSGNYSPRNPMGVWYGTLGRNTPLRVSVVLASDTFTRTATNSWGTSDTGRTYSLAGSGGVVTSANWNVASGVGAVALTSVNISRTTTLVGLSLRDVDVSITATMPFATVTGAAIYPLVIKLRDQGSTNYFYARTIVNTDGSIQLDSRRGDGTAISSGAVTVAGLTYSGQALTMRAQVEGQTIRAKVWERGLGEPYDWQLTANTTFITTPGLVGIISWVPSGNTNTLPIVVSYDNLTVRVPRFTGEVAAWPQRWDISGQDVYVPIEAAGITRRLGQGAAPLRSALYRYYAQLATPPVAYWPCEDPPSSSAFASAVGGPTLVPSFGFSGVGTLVLNNSWITFASYTAYPGSSPLPVFPAVGTLTGANVSTLLRGSPPSFSNTGIVLTRFLFRAPLNTSSVADPSGTRSVVNIVGLSSAWSIDYVGSGFLALSCNSVNVSSFSVNGDIRGRDLLYSVMLIDTGGNVAYNVTALEVGATSGVTTLAGTKTGVSVGGFLRVDVNASEFLFDFSLGHVAVRTDGSAGVADIQSPFQGWSGETAGARMQRLCAEEGISFSYRGDLTQSALVGPQDAGSGTSTGNSLTSTSTGKTLLNVLNEAEDVDRGTLYEPRGQVGLAYRTRSDAYTQIPTLNLDYTAGQVASPLDPVDDDQLTRNNVIITRINGQSAEAELITGQMSTLDPSAGGAGGYNVQYTLNVDTDDQLPDLAAWLLTLGTVNEARYPSITVDLANPATVAAGVESAVLAVDIDDCITISNPKTGTTPDQIRQLARGYTEILNVYKHTITFNCSPESPYRVATLDSTPLMRVDTSTSTLVSGVSSSATSLSVANFQEPWTTDPAEMPIPIVVSGELMNVTAVSGTSSPQTFTVVRSVNSVVKAQLAGATVEIYPLNSATVAL